MDIKAAAQLLSQDMVSAFTVETMQRISQIKMLAHYTSIDALASILRTKELWLSSARDMNDIEEVTGATATIASALEEFGPGIFKSIRFNSTGAPQQFQAYRATMDADTYIFSLSDHGHEEDRVAMWGNYGHGGNGICLVFRKEAMLDQRADGMFPIKWAPVFYGSTETLAADTKNALEKMEALFWKHRPFIQQISSDKVGYLIAVALVTRVPSHKHMSFEFEREVRFVHTAPLQFAPLPLGAGVRDIGTPACPKKIFVVPLRNYPEWNVNAEISNLIDHVIVEPSDAKADRVLEVRKLLDTHGLSHIAVRASTSPFRPKKHVTQHV